MKARVALGLVAVTLAASACTHRGAPASPHAVAMPRIFPGDSAQIRAGKLAEYITHRWPSISVDQVEADRKGTVIQFQDQPKFDYSIKDPDEYQEHVKRVTADLAQASVELLKLTMHYFPHLQYASVWQDSQLKAYWTREGIDAMASPQTYHSYQSYLKLIMTAQFPPPGVRAPPAPTS